MIIFIYKMEVETDSPVQCSLVDNLLIIKKGECDNYYLLFDMILIQIKVMWILLTCKPTSILLT